jgi:hypothetical protein
MSQTDYQAIQNDLQTWKVKARWACRGTLANYLRDFERLASKIAEGKERELNALLHMDINPVKDSHVEEDQEVISLLQTSINRLTEKFLEENSDQQLNKSMLRAHLKKIHDTIQDNVDSVLSKERVSSFDISSLKDKYTVKLREELQSNHTRSMKRFFRKQGADCIDVQRRTGYDDTVELIDAITAERYALVNDLLFPEAQDLKKGNNRSEYFTSIITPKMETKQLSSNLVEITGDTLQRLISLDDETFARQIKQYQPATIHGAGRKGTSLKRSKVKEKATMTFRNIS